MEELTIEQKAKAYDEALEKARIAYKDEDMHLKATLERIFKELIKESEDEDERIRKQLKAFIHSRASLITQSKHDSWIAWLEKQAFNVDNANKEYWRGYREGKQEILDKYAELEKQSEQKSIVEMKSPEESLGIDSDTYNKIVDECIYGEQKSADKIKPKFKVDDWIIKNDDSHINIDYICCKIIKVENGNYTIESIYGYKGYNTFDTFEKDYHLWTIQDAKDGDVLACDSKHGQEIGIVKKYIGKYGGCDSCFETYCFVDWDDIFRVGEYMGSRNIHPAINEQRDLLFKKMKEAGYEFDFEKKELKKIEQKPADKVEPKFKVGQTIKKEGFNSGFPIVKIENGFYYNDMGDNFPFTDQDNWKLVEQKPAWSEEDEKCIRLSTDIIDSALRAGFCVQLDRDRCVDWLKSLRPQKQWKPSEEQIASITCAVRKMKESACYDSELVSLFNDLKKLKG